jgi:excinuclease ABC subunit A
MSESHSPAEEIAIRGARLHNLKNITVSIPKNKLVVLTGVSGSGKSTLGFDILLKEGQRQYMEALGMLTFGLTRPPVDSITGLAPTISVDQHLTNHSPRSTVGTQTDVYTYLRVLFARLGHRPCPACGRDVPPDFNFSGDPTASLDEEEDLPAQPCPHCAHPLPGLNMASFSFNKPAGACPTCTGLGTIHSINLARLVDENKSILAGAIDGWDANYTQYYITILRAAARHYGFRYDSDLALKDYTPAQRDLLFHGVLSEEFRRHYPDVNPPATVNKGRFEGVEPILLRRMAEHVEDEDYLERRAGWMRIDTCPDCQGTRLKPEIRQVEIHGKTIVDVARLPLTGLFAWLEALPIVLSEQEYRIAQPILDGLLVHIRQLVDVGAGYLTVERSSPSLSAGEAQRLRLAGLLGSELSGLLYVFDEPTIGLHQRDTRSLVEVLRRLRDLGNTVLVIEHDLETIAAADYVIDFGPGAGQNGGRVVAHGTPAEVAGNPASITGKYLSGKLRQEIPARSSTRKGRELVIRGARHHNLKNITVTIPLGVLTAVTGVSGSGKTSLVFDILDRALRRHLNNAAEEPGGHDSIEGCEQLDQVITIDQQHIGRIPRSNAATYSEVFTPIRSLFSSSSEAQRLGLSARHFSFNVPGGRCEHCQGTGVIAIPMQFLPAAEVTCPVCRGRRFTPAVLQVKYQGKDISQVLDLTVDEALETFREVPGIRGRLQSLADVGLGYVQLGQPAVTLSGGEAQRVKLARELGRRSTGRTLYLLDEPTTGLHPADVATLLKVLRRLVEAGNSVLVVEHNLDLVRTADWVIDLGPEGGEGGGWLLAEGTPDQIARVEASHTGRCLLEYANEVGRIP